MRKILFIAIVIGLGFSACKKENDAQPTKVKIEKKTMDGEDGGDASKDGTGSGGGWGG